MTANPIHPRTVSRLPFEVDEVIAGRTGAACLFAVHGLDEQPWLVVLDDQGVDGRRLLCAPASDLAIGCVRSGRAQPADLFRHSRTGTVEIITIGVEGRMVESIRLCAELSDDELPVPSGLFAQHRCD